jgi:cytochrome c oxidase subunit 2
MPHCPTSWGRARRAIPLAAFIASACTGPELPQNSFHPVTDFGETLNRVFFNTFGWTMAILVLVLVLIAIVLLKYRERPGAPQPKQIHGNTILEIVWTLIPAVIVTFMAVPAVQAVFTTQQRPAAEALEIEVIGHQWWWEFRYPSEGVVTANQFYIPTGREVHLRLSSADVIHSFWVPRLGGKRDVNPVPRGAEGEGARANHMVFTASQPGRYRGQCAEFCGEAHAIMAMYSVAVTPEEFTVWVESMRDTQAAANAAETLAVPPAVDSVNAPAAATQQSLAEEGRTIFLGKTCIACHAIANTPARGLIGPNLTRFGARPTVGAGAAPMSQENVERWIRDPQSLKAGALMPGASTPAAGFPPTGLTEDEIRKIAAYLVSLK